MSSKTFNGYTRDKLLRCVDIITERFNISRAELYEALYNPYASDDEEWMGLQMFLSDIMPYYRSQWPCIDMGSKKSISTCLSYPASQFQMFKADILFNMSAISPYEITIPPDACKVVSSYMPTVDWFSANVAHQKEFVKGIRQELGVDGNVDPVYYYSYLMDGVFNSYIRGSPAEAFIEYMNVIDTQGFDFDNFVEIYAIDKVSFDDYNFVSNDASIHDLWTGKSLDNDVEWLRDYIKKGYQRGRRSHKINKITLNVYGPRYRQYVIDAIAFMIQKLEEMIETAPPTENEILVFRGMTSDEFMSPSQNTTNINMEGFTSTSLLAMKAARFTTHRKSQTDTKMPAFYKITVPNGSKCLVATSNRPVESELIFAPNMKFTYKNRNCGKDTIYLLDSFLGNCNGVKVKMCEGSFIEN